MSVGLLQAWREVQRKILITPRASWRVARPSQLDSQQVQLCCTHRSTTHMRFRGKCSLDDDVYSVTSEQQAAFSSHAIICNPTEAEIRRPVVLLLTAIVCKPEMVYPYETATRSETRTFFIEGLMHASFITERDTESRRTSQESSNDRLL